MEVARGLADNGIVIGNTYDKYGSENFLVKSIMGQFALALNSLVERVNPVTIHEVGCGEGYWVFQWHRRGIQARGTDFSNRVIEIARSNAETFGVPSSAFQTRSIYDLGSDDAADLIVCCEVLEHLEDPAKALQVLQRVVMKRLILSVPREPLWRALNVMRGKYVANYGNTPGHLQHWSKREFVNLINNYFNVVEVRQPLPWTMLLCQPK